MRTRCMIYPTSSLTLPAARTAFIAYAYARNQGGEFVITISDTGEPATKEQIESLYEDFAWLGIEGDEGPLTGGAYGPYVLSERKGLYGSTVDRLISEGKAYECYCTNEELEERRKARLLQGNAIGYDNACRSLTEEARREKRAQGMRPRIRLRVPEKEIVWTDLIRGEGVCAGAEVGDFVLIDEDRMPRPVLMMCVDDGVMNITHVIRDEEFYSQTARQTVLAEACGFSIPVYGHVPMVMGSGGEAVSRRTGAYSLAEYRAMGYFPETIINVLVSLWGEKQDEANCFLTMRDVIKRFSFKNFSQNPVVFHAECVDRIGRMHMGMMDDDLFLKMTVPYILEKDIVPRAQYLRRPEWYSHVLLLIRCCMSSLGDAKEWLAVFGDTIMIQDTAILTDEPGPAIIREYLKEVVALEHISFTDFVKLMKRIKKRCEKKGWMESDRVVRMALTGRTDGPDIGRIASLLGKPICMKRLENALKVST